MTHSRFLFVGELLAEGFGLVILRERVPNMYWERDWLGCRTVKYMVFNWENIRFAGIAPLPSGL